MALLYVKHCGIWHVFNFRTLRMARYAARLMEIPAFARKG